MGLDLFGENCALSQIKNIIAIGAGKGGVGKSTVTVQLARALKAHGLSVGILDADVYGPSIRHMLPEHVMPSQEGERVIPAESEGIKTISVAFFNQGHSASIVRAPIANGIIQQFITQVEWGQLDYLLVDFPPGTGDVQLTLMQQVDFAGAIVVTTPQEVALLDVMKATEMFMQMNIQVLGVIENMSYYILPNTNEQVELFGSNGASRLCDAWGIELLGKIPVDPRLSKEGKASDCAVFMELVQRLEEGSPSLQCARCELVDGGKEIKLDEASISCHEVQKGCPCIRCQNGERRVSDDVHVDQLTPVGKYGVKLHFSSGCSKGIYAYEYLRQFA